MFFKNKKATEKPLIENQKEYIEWFLRNSDDIAPYRALYDIDTFVKVFNEISRIMLMEYPTADKLFERVGDFAVANEKFKPMVEKRGGLAKCPDMIKNGVVELLVKIAVGEEFLIKKYKHKVSIELKSRYS